MKRSAWVSMPMPDADTAIKFIGWASGRLAFMALSTSLAIIKNTARAIIWLSEKVENGLELLTRYYDALPYMGMPQSVIEIEATQSSVWKETQQVQQTDILSAIQSKHLLIIGETGSGKSTIAQYIAAQSSSQVKVYDADASISDWKGLNVIGKGGDFGSINASMNEDIEELESRIQLRSESGDNALSGKELCIIAEEFPSLKDECEIAPTWLGKLARRGRKPKMFVIALSQSDSVQALGIEGDGAIRQNFRYLRLGKFAVSHAKKIGNDALIAWLKAGQYRCTIDDDPCQLPVISPHQLVPFQLATSSVQANSGAQMPLEPTETDFPGYPTSAHEEVLKPILKRLKSEGYSNSMLIKIVLGYTGGRYQQGRELLEKLLK